MSESTHKPGSNFLEKNYINVWRLLRDPSIANNATNISLLIGIATGLTGDLKRRNGARLLIRFIDRQLALDPDMGQYMSLHFNACNAHCILRHIYGSIENREWEWDHPQAPKELFHLRSVSRCPAFRHTPAEFQCEIHVNTANVLSFLGRGIEAVEEWDRAIAIERNFGMAIGNRGQGLETIARSLESDLDIAMYVRSAINDYRISVNECDVEPSIKKEWGRRMASLEDWLPEAWAIFDPDQLILRERNSNSNKDADEYHNWCRKNRLFVHYLNDIEAGKYCHSDSLSLPTFTTSFNEPPKIIGLFNQIKQEFVSARFFVYQSITDLDPHYSDERVHLVDTLDYPVYSLRVERLKAAYRAAFSALNRIALFINWYFDLGHREDRITCKNVWNQKPNSNSPLHATFNGKENLCLRGLYWLMLDVAGPDEDRKLILDPCMLDIQKIRNHLEHQYLKIVAFDTPDNEVADQPAYIIDTPTYTIGIEQFIFKSIVLLKILRNSILQLAQAVVVEERDRESRRVGVYAPVQLPRYSE